MSAAFVQFVIYANTMSFFFLHSVPCNISYSWYWKGKKRTKKFSTINGTKKIPKFKPCKVPEIASPTTLQSEKMFYPKHVCLLAIRNLWASSVLLEEMKYSNFSPHREIAIYPLQLSVLKRKFPRGTEDRWNY